ncbi:MAG: beta-galactosidase GalA [Candidatus Coatesbacteria bacterium]
MKRTALLAAAWVVATTASARERLFLDEGWRFRLGETEAFSVVPEGTPIAGWEILPVPGKVAGDDPLKIPRPKPSATGWRAAAVDEDVLGGRKEFIWFRTTLPDVPGPDRGIWFTMVDDNGTFYLNGIRIGQHNGWDDPFELKLSKGWKPGGPNVLEVLVENSGAGPCRIGRAAIYKGAAKLATMSAPCVATGFDDSGWRRVDVPHDFVVEGEFTRDADRGHGYLPAGVGWYRRSFDLPASDAGKRLMLEFDGVYHDSTVWLNGVLLGGNRSGYTSFWFDATAAANPGGRNILVVRCDARQNEGWWYEGGGIYRHVWLTRTDPVHVDHWGTFVSTPEVGPKGAKTRIRTSVRNDGTAPVECVVVSTILDPAGKEAGRAETRKRLAPGTGTEFTQSVTVKGPALWSPETPVLYSLRTSVRANGAETDTEETPFGIRTIRFDAVKGFFLNGKPVKINGTCNHQDFAGVGVALPDRLNWFKIETLKAWGVNGYRCSHHPPTPEILEACDRLGMLVMDENRHLGDSADILGQVESMVRRDRNHPSIVIWSTCNEEGHQGTDLAKRQGAAIRDVIRRWDGTRPVTSAMNQRPMWGKGLTLVEDVQGTNYNPEGYDEFHKKHPRMPMVSTESHSTTTTRGIYWTDTTAGFCSSYNDHTQYCWWMVATRPFVAGTFVWTGFDYRGEPSPYDWPCINSHFGFLDTCGFPKDDAWYYKAWWGTSPSVHVFPHWNPDGKTAGKPVNVRCYANTDEVELFVNGTSAGKKKILPQSRVDWEVPYTPGSLVVKGFTKGVEVASETTETTGAPAAVRLVADRATLKADREDVSVVRVEIVDAKGRVVPVADNEVSFSVAGVGRIIGVGNGNPSSHEPDKAARRKAFNGLCLVLVQSTAQPGTATLTATAPGLTPATATLTMSPAPQRPSLPAEVK